MRPRRAALGSLRGALCFWPETVTPTSSVLVAFHCARRLRVFARDILRLGVAMVGPYSSIWGFGSVCRAARPVGPRATIGYQNSRWPAGGQNAGHREVLCGRPDAPQRHQPRRGILDVAPAVPANLPVGWVVALAGNFRMEDTHGLCFWSIWCCPDRELLGFLRRPAFGDARDAHRRRCGIP